MSRSVRKPRAANWSKDEQFALVNAIQPVYGELFGKHSSKVTMELKGKLWDQIYEQVNAAAASERSLSDIKEKFTDMKSKTKKKAALAFGEMRKTGGGEAEEDSQWDVIVERIHCMDTFENTMAKLIGKEAVLGISGISLDSGAGPSTQGFTSREPITDTSLVPFVTGSDERASSTTITEMPPTPEMPTTPEPPRKKKRIQNDDVAQQMLKAQVETMEATQRIADAMEQLVRVMQLKHNL